MAAALLWVPFTLAGSVAQVVRNSAQASLTARIGTLGATQTRFVFGLPFAALYLAVVLAWSGRGLPRFDAAAWRWTLLAALTQIAATALMLVVMGRRAFAVAYAYIKTEPVIVAISGVLLLGDVLPALAWLAVVVVTAGVLVASVRPGDWGKLLGEGRMIGVGLLSGGLFGIASIAARGGAAALGQEAVMLRSLSVLVASLVVQTVLLGAWLLAFDRAAFAGSLREWRTSLGAGCAGATASACFFTAFALAPAANSRTLALIELPMAAAVSWRWFGRELKRHELIGLGMIMAGVAALLWAHA